MSEGMLTALTPRSSGRLQSQWKQRWTEGSKTSRRIIIAGCVVVSLLVATVIGVSCFALYFSSNCPKLCAFRDSFTYPPLAPPGSQVILKVGVLLLATVSRQEPRRHTSLDTLGVGQLAHSLEHLVPQIFLWLRWVVYRVVSCMITALFMKSESL